MSAQSLAAILRDRCPSGAGCRCTFNEAADEIDRLSSQVAELIECIKTCAVLAYIEGQAAERERIARLMEWTEGGDSAKADELRSGAHWAVGALEL
jgi:hypothetical protein